jgi:hypothetical protein
MRYTVKATHLYDGMTDSGCEYKVVATKARPFGVATWKTEAEALADAEAHVERDHARGFMGSVVTTREEK